MRRFIKNSYFSLLGFLFPTILIVIAYPIIITKIGLEAFGLYTLANSISGILLFLDFGLSTAAIKFIAEDIAIKNKVQVANTIVTTTIAYSIFGLIGFLAIYFSIPYLLDFLKISIILKPEANELFKIAAFQFPITILVSVFVSFFKGFQRFDISTIMLSMLSALTYVGAIFGIIFAEFGVIQIALVGLISNIVMVIIAPIVLLQLARKLNIELKSGIINLLIIKKMISFSSIMTFNSICTILQSKFQLYLVGYFIGPSAVSIYSLGLTIPSKVHAAINALTEVLFPFTSGNENYLELRAAYIKMLLGGGAISFVILLPLGLYAKYILSIWLGGDISELVFSLVPIFCLSIFFISLSAAPFHIINGLGYPKINTLFNFIAAISNMLIIAVLAILDKISLGSLAWSFTFSSIISSLTYLIFIENNIWRNMAIGNYRANGAIKNV